MKPFTFLLWRHLLNFPECLFYKFPAVNAPPYCSLQPQTWFTDQIFIFILLFDDRGCKMATTPYFKQSSEKN